MQGRRTDLALESKLLAEKSTRALTEEDGVRAAEERLFGFPLTAVDVLNENGAAALRKSKGRYLTLELKNYWLREEGGFSRAVEALAEALRRLLPEHAEHILVAGLGNAAMTPDALGSMTLRHLLVTRHLRESVPFRRFPSVAALAAEVAGNSGMEAAEQVEALTKRLHPELVIVIDALAAQGLDRLLNTVQLSDAGLVPGSGVGNHRMALRQETLGVPVLSLGVPTVVEGRTLALDLLENAGLAGRDCSVGEGLFVTPKDADAKIADLARLIGYALNRALHGLSAEDSAALLG